MGLGETRTREGAWDDGEELGISKKEKTEWGESNGIDDGEIEVLRVRCSSKLTGIERKWTTSFGLILSKPSLLLTRKGTSFSWNYTCLLVKTLPISNSRHIYTLCYT